jgi:hypothetical protein
MDEVPRQRKEIADRRQSTSPLEDLSGFSGCPVAFASGASRPPQPIVVNTAPAASEPISSRRFNDSMAVGLPPRCTAEVEVTAEDNGSLDVQQRRKASTT